ASTSCSMMSFVFGATGIVSTNVRTSLKNWNERSSIPLGSFRSMEHSKCTACAARAARAKHVKIRRSSRQDEENVGESDRPNGSRVRRNLTGRIWDLRRGNWHLLPSTEDLVLLV